MIVKQVIASAILTVCLTSALPANAQWKELLDSLGGGGSSGSPAVSAVLSNEDVIAGLKEALGQGARRAVESLGRTDGFFRNAEVRIPVPEKLKTVESALRALKQDRYADEFVLTMNRAAERAVPEAGAILSDAIRNMSVDDAKRILNGPDDAATQYFRKVGGQRLTERMRPIVSEATSRAGVTSAYKSLLDKAGFAASLVDADAVDIDGYVTREALDGLFLLIAQEEKRIRADPLARSTELLKKVFSSVDR
jgi:hypothetical protein